MIVVNVHTIQSAADLSLFTHPEEITYRNGAIVPFTIESDPTQSNVTQLHAPYTADWRPLTEKGN